MLRKWCFRGNILVFTKLDYPFIELWRTGLGLFVGAIVTGRISLNTQKNFISYPKSYIPSTDYLLMKL